MQICADHITSTTEQSCSRHSPLKMYNRSLPGMPIKSSLQATRDSKFHCACLSLVVAGVAASTFVLFLQLAHIMKLPVCVAHNNDLCWLWKVDLQQIAWTSRREEDVCIATWPQLPLLPLGPTSSNVASALSTVKASSRILFTSATGSASCSAAYPDCAVACTI